MTEGRNSSPPAGGWNDRGERDSSQTLRFKIVEEEVLAGAEYSGYSMAYSMKFELEAKKRDILGKKVKTLRAQGLMPAELYGHGVENVHLAIPVKDFVGVYDKAGENTLVILKIDGEERPVLVHGVDYDSLSDTYRAADFYQVRMDEKTTADIPLILVGEAPAIKDKGGVLITVVNEIEVEALPADLPHELTIDISGLAEIGASIHARDIKVPTGVELLIEPEAVLVTISEKQAEEVVEKGPTDVSQVEVEGEKKEGEKEGEGEKGEEKKKED